ncbi:class I SAM-dependent methyltransferase family protein, partial [Accumulibacter sp.]|uniref:class I SAM-dependent methyltransferase family protein n=1 Tax=Accumulibacter sp. TaxID=2053492 RepID=UPI001A421958
RGVRVRREHLLRAVATAAEQLLAAGETLRIADVAAGHGRYVLDAVAQLPERPQSIVLRDLSELNVAQGRALIAERRLGDIARFEQGDAFDEAALATLGTPAAAPNLVTVSGLYELFSDNELVGRSLRGLARAMNAEGYLVYTGQPWHPQIELIARTLTSHRDQRAWVMRRRTQAEMDELVRAAGFAKIEQWIDEWGMFTVSLARRL